MNPGVSEQWRVMAKVGVKLCKSSRYGGDNGGVAAIFFLAVNEVSDRVLVIGVWAYVWKE